jgi:hypothetical protein
MSALSDTSSTSPQAESQASPEKLGFKEKLKSKDVWKGVGLLALCHLVWLVIPFAYIAISVVQVLYAVPLIIILNRKKKDLMAQGVMLGMGFTFLINATCFGIVVSQLGAH